MIVFSQLRTPRLQVDLRELRATDSIYLCQIPDDRGELGTQEFLKFTVQLCEKPRKGQVVDTRMWTVQERAFVVAHYLAHVLGEGGDFQIGENGRLSNYLRDISAPPEREHVADVGGRRYDAVPLLGFHAEAIERLVVAGELNADRSGWIVGSMGAMLLVDDQAPLDPNEMDVRIDEGLAERCTNLLALPESEFVYLIERWLDVLTGPMTHIFEIGFADSGIVFTPSKEVPALLPARFPVSDALRETTRHIFGSPEQPDT